ncbi:hypothetical protein ACF0H5_012626 [Mactra antiquata]
MGDDNQVKIGVMVASIISLVLQIIGCVTPGWLYVSARDVSLQSGLWYTVTCIHSHCVTASSVSGIGGVSYTSGLYMTLMAVYQGLTVTGILLCLLAVILLISSRFASVSSDGPVKIATIVLILSGLLALAASGKFGAGILTAIRSYSYSRVEHPYKFPYSLFMTGVGGVIAFVLFLYLVCTVCRKRDGPTSGPQTGIVLSTVPHGRV